MIKKLWHALETRGIAHHNLSDMNDWSLLDPQPTPLRRSPYVAAYDPEMPAMLHAVCSLPVKGAKMRRVDFLGVPFDELPAALIYFTGNQVSRHCFRLCSAMSNFLALFRTVLQSLDEAQSSSPRLPP